YDYNVTVLSCRIGRLTLEWPAEGQGSPQEQKTMVKRPRAPVAASGAPKGPTRPRPDVVQSSVYLPEPVYEALRETAFKERCKIHDVVMEGIGLALRKRGYPALTTSKRAGSDSPADQPPFRRRKRCLKILRDPQWSERCHGSPCRIGRSCH